MRQNWAQKFLAAAFLAAAVLPNDALRADEPAAETPIRRALAKRVELKYVEQPLGQVAADLQTKLGIPISIDHKALDEAGIGTDAPVTLNISNVSAKAAIGLMLRPLNLTTVVRHEVLMITTPEQADNMLEAKVYDVADLVSVGVPENVHPDFDSLIDLIQSCLHPTTWDNVGGPGSIAPFEAAGIKVFVVSQTDEVHEAIENLFAELRTVRDRKTKGGKGSASSDGKSQPSGATVDPRLPRIAEAEVALRKALAKPITFQFKNIPLGKVVAALKEKTGLQIVVDTQGGLGTLLLPPHSPPAAKIDLAVSNITPVTAEVANVALELALDRMLNPLGLTWTYHHECLLITTPEREDQLLVARSYDVSDLPAYRDEKGKGVPDYEAMIDSIKATINPTSWDDVGGPGQLAVFDQAGLQQITITQLWKTHLNIEQLLVKLRQVRGPLLTAGQIAKLPPLPPPGETGTNYHGGRRPAGEPEGPPTPPPQPDPQRDAVVHANNQFAFDLYKQVGKKRGKHEQENVFFSPSSIATALAMVYAGARGQTAEEMAKTLHLTMPQEDVAPAFQSLLATLPGANHRGCQLTMANALWGQRGSGFTDAYLGTIRKRFGAELTEVDFAQPEAVCQAINGWVDKKTEGKIPQIVGPETINRDLRFVLTNAIYLKGQWSKRFDKSTTERALFHGHDNAVEVPMMWQLDSCRYGLADNVQILEKTYRGRDLAMMILLPDAEPESLADLERVLSAEKVKEWSLQLREKSVKVYLPRFKLETSLDLGESLAAMGMAKVFQANQSDLSGIDGGKTPLWLGWVLHRALVCVDEEGTEAAAATAMGFMGGLPPPMPVFRADHPFVFLIRDTRTGNILFVGRLMKPDPAPPEMPKMRLPGASHSGEGLF